jgi:hypothetical protein
LPVTTPCWIAIASSGEFRKLLFSIVMYCQELIQIFFSLGDLLPVKVQFSTVAPLARSFTAQKLDVPVNVQSSIVTFVALALICTVALPKLMPLSTAPA